MPESRNLVWRQTLVALVYDPLTGELREPLDVLAIHDQLARARRALQACLAQPLAPEVVALVHTALTPTSHVPLDGQAVACPSCGLPGYMPAHGEG